MTHRVKVTGYAYLEDDEFDPGPLGPLTNEADANWRGFGEKESPRIETLDDLEVVLAEED